MSEETRQTLLQVLNETPQKRRQIIADSVVVLEDEVKSKRGFSGKAIQLAFGAVKKVKPGILEDLIDMLLDEFVEELQPFYHEYLELDESTRSSFARYLSDQSHDVAEALLAVTDRRRQRASNRALIKIYDKLRSTALNHVEQGVPAVGQLMQRHAF